MAAQPLSGPGQHLATRLCVADVEQSVFFDNFVAGRRDITAAAGSRIEGIGRPRCEPSFVSDVIDRMLRVADAASLAAMLVLSERLGRRVGPSTGTNFYAMCRMAAQMRGAADTGSLVTLICDAGERYLGTYYSAAWRASAGFDVAPHVAQLQRFLDSGEWVGDGLLADSAKAPGGSAR